MCEVEAESPLPAHGNRPLNTFTLPSNLGCAPPFVFQATRYSSILRMLAKVLRYAGLVQKVLTSFLIGTLPDVHLWSFLRLQTSFVNLYGIPAASLAFFYFFTLNNVVSNLLLQLRFKCHRSAHVLNCALPNRAKCKLMERKD